MKVLRFALWVAVIFALFVVMLGAYTRLTDAGLGCPDWPGCYGKIVLPSEGAARELAQRDFPGIPIEAPKAWTEMAHRYAAGTLALLIFFISIRGLFLVRRQANLPRLLPVFLMSLVVLQALLGMWTVTLKLLPVVVMAHLCGGMLVFASLSRYLASVMQAPPQEKVTSPISAFWLMLGVFFLFTQIMLGGWVSANYAGISCIGFPLCNGQWLPQLDFSQGFYLFSPVGANYQGGLLEHDARATIQWIHRLWAMITAVYLFALSVFILRKSRDRLLRSFSIILIALLLVQLSLGVINVIYLLPLSSAVLHNGVAALLLACLFCLDLYSKRGRT